MHTHKHAHTSAHIQTPKHIGTHTRAHTYAHMHMHAHVAHVMGFANFLAWLATPPHLSIITMCESRKLCFMLSSSTIHGPIIRAMDQQKLGSMHQNSGTNPTQVHHLNSVIAKKQEMPPQWMATPICPNKIEGTACLMCFLAILLIAAAYLSPFCVSHYQIWNDSLAPTEPAVFLPLEGLAFSSFGIIPRRFLLLAGPLFIEAGRFPPPAAAGCSSSFKADCSSPDADASTPSASSPADNDSSANAGAGAAVSVFFGLPGRLRAGCSSSSPLSEVSACTCGEQWSKQDRQ